MFGAVEDPQMAWSSCRSNTIILVLVIALFFIQLHYINLSIQYVPQASRESIVKNKY